MEAELQHRNVWDFQACDPSYGSPYPGRIPGQIVANLLHHYTKPGALIIDPMAGSGTTVDVCRRLDRRVEAFDIRPVRSEIRRADVLSGVPLPSGCADFVFLDPPYWDMKRGCYSAEPTDFSQLSYEAFLGALEALRDETYRLLKVDGCCALLISSRRKRGTYYDLAFEGFDIFRRVLSPIERICVPYHYSYSETTGEWASWRTPGKLLRAFRDLMVFVKAAN